MSYSRMTLKFILQTGTLFRAKEGDINNYIRAQDVSGDSPKQIRICGHVTLTSYLSKSYTFL